MKKTRILTTLFFAIFILSCGPSCPESKNALDETAAISEDVLRVNSFVDKRKAAMAEAQQGIDDQFHLAKLKFSVKAYEQAIEVQIRIIKLSSKFDNSPAYKEHQELINKIRCDFDKLLKNDGHLVSDRMGRTIQTYHKSLNVLLRKEQSPSSSELKNYIKNGIKSTPIENEEEN